MNTVTVNVTNSKVVVNVGLVCNDQIFGYDGTYYYATYKTSDKSYYNKRVSTYIATKDALIKYDDVKMRFHPNSQLRLITTPRVL